MFHAARGEHVSHYITKAMLQDMRRLTKESNYHIITIMMPPNFIS